jgi:hypothetical protein
MSTSYPVAVFCYNRPNHLRKTLNALRCNKEASATSLFLFSDGPGNKKDDFSAVEEVRELIDKVEGFNEVKVVKRQSNMGLAASVIQGVTEVLNENEACIVLEDDLEVSASFLSFMNQALRYYHGDERIFSVSGYCPPIAIPRDYPYEAFLFPRINSWGWGTWRDRWNGVDWNVEGFEQFIFNQATVDALSRQGEDLPVMLLKQQQGKIGSWAVRFNQACFEKGKTNVYPVMSLVRNLGADGTGTNMKSSGKYSVQTLRDKLKPFPAAADERINRTFRKFYRPSLYRRMVNRIKIFLYRQRMS